MRLGISAIARGIKNRISRGIHRRNVRSSIRSTDAFLITYPKSGTIWLSFMLANVLKPDSSEKLNLQTLLKYVPDVNEIYFHKGTLNVHASLKDPRIFSLHAPYDSAFRKVVYVVRDPRDVAVSYWHFRRLTEADFKLTLRQFVEDDHHWPCRWEKHVAEWLLNHRHPNLLQVKYEDLTRDTPGVLKRIVGFLGVTADRNNLARAVEASNFANMQALEAKFGVHGVENVGAGRFVRKGQVEGWKQELDEPTLRILEDKCSPVMGKVGYPRIT